MKNFKALFALFLAAAVLVFGAAAELRSRRALRVSGMKKFKPNRRSFDGSL
jgi:hypothetical protein